MEHYLLFLNIISQRMNIYIDYQRTNSGKFSVKYREAKLWNNLPENLRNQKSHGRFKRMIKKYTVVSIPKIDN